MRHAAWLMVALFLATQAVGAAQEELAISGDVRLALPVGTCTIPALARRIAEDLKMPAGIEALPGPCVGPRRVRDRVSLSGMTLAEAMDKAIGEDPRYWWTFTDGVLVVRPLEAWGEREHFLHRPLASFQIDDRNLDGITAAVRQAITGGVPPSPVDRPMQTDEGNRKLSVDMVGTSIYEALNQVVRAHGSLIWQLSYCRAPARQESSDIMFRTFDGSGLTTGMKVSTAAESTGSCRQQPPLF